MTAQKRPASAGGLVGTYGLLAITVLVFVLFAALLPSTFPTGANIKAILTNQSIPAILAMAATIPIVTGRFDLSIGYGIGLTHVLAMWLLVQHGLPWPVVVVVLLVCGVAVGLANGFLVELARIDSFIATLGTGSILYVVGANPRAADLMGIKRRRIVIAAFVGSGVVTAFAGVLLAAQQQIGDPSAGSSYLLPAFVGALLGSTTIKPGRANAFGTLIAVAVLAIGLSGLQQKGAAFWVTPLFNGLTLLAAVGLAGFAARRRQRAAAVIGSAARPGDHTPQMNVIPTYTKGSSSS